MKAMKRLSLYAALAALWGGLLSLHTTKSEAAEPEGPYTYCASNPDDPICTGKPQESAAAESTVTGRNSVLLFASEDCSGRPAKITSSTPKLADQSIRARSFAVESGSPASAWQQAGYSGAKTEFVGPSICVSPGWEIAGIRLQGY